MMRTVQVRETRRYANALRTAIERMLSVYHNLQMTGKAAMTVQGNLLFK